MRAIHWARRKLGWRATAVMAAVLAMAASGIAIPGQAFASTATPHGITPPPGVHCSQVDFIGARGSGQPFDTGGPFKGYGPEVLKTITIMEGYLHAKKVSYGAEPVKYPADSVNDLKPSTIDFVDWNDYLNNHLGKFVKSINTGISETVDYAEWAQQTCHNSKIIMVGYSQGAIVMHDAEVQLKTKDRAAFNLIIGTVLVADGVRMPKTKAKQFGSAPVTGEGVEPWVFSAAGLGNPFKDVPLPASTASICNDSDIVCDTSLAALVHFNASAKVHTTSYANCNSKNQCSYGSALINGATWAGKIAASKV